MTQESVIKAAAPSRIWWSGLSEPGNPTVETKKRVRSLLALWKTLENLEKEYPDGMIMLMDGSAPFDILVIDPKSGWLRAVEVKSAPSPPQARVEVEV